MEISERLRTLRHDHGWKLREVSQKTKLSISYLSDMERGVTHPSLETCQKLANVYRVTLSRLLEDVKVTK